MWVFGLSDPVMACSIVPLSIYRVAIFLEGIALDVVKWMSEILSERVSSRFELYGV